MRVLYFVPRYWPSIGGAQLVSRELIQRISRRHAVRVITQFTRDQDSFVDSVVNAEPGRYWDEHVAVNRIGPTGMPRSILRSLSRVYGRWRLTHPLFAWLLNAALLPQIGECVADFKPDLVHAVHIGLVYSSETAYRAARQARLPFVWTPFPHIEGDSGWRGPRFRALYRLSDAIIAMTEREKAWLIQNGATEQRVRVIPIGPLVNAEGDARAFRDAYNLAHHPVVLFLGQKFHYKGYQQLVAAAPRVWEYIPETRFVLIGPPTPESESFFKTVSDPRILELPSVNAQIKNSALAACDIFCMPSTQESLGAVYLEAWSFRKPVIAANIDIAQEVIEHGQDGLLVEQETHAIATAIVQLLEDNAARAKLGAAGYRKIKEIYNWDRITATIESLYHELLT